MTRKAPDLHKQEADARAAMIGRKPLLMDIYLGFYRGMAEYVTSDLDGPTVELGAAGGLIKEVVPDCVTTDIFPGNGIDRTENIYELQFGNSSLSNVFMLHVFHHLRYPGTALKEVSRVLAPGGRLIILDPCMSLLGFFVYGLLHHEPVGWRDVISWWAPDEFNCCAEDYYAAQGNAARVFLGKEFQEFLSGWKLLGLNRSASVSYILSGGISKPQCYPRSMLPFMQSVDRVCDLFPRLFATNILVVLEKEG